MADDKLPSEYDAIVLGTGMTECIIAAALSRIGLQVLHLDRNDYYSGDWGTFHFEALQKWISKQKEIGEDALSVKKVDITTLLKEGEKTLPLQVESKAVYNVTDHIYIQENGPETGPPARSLVSECKDGYKMPPADVASSPLPSLDTSDNHPVPPEDTGDNHSVLPRVTTDRKPVDPCVNTEESQQMVTGCQDGIQDATLANCLDHTSSIELKTPEEKDESVSEKMLDDAKPKEWTFADLKKQWRKFNIDLQPKMLYCRGPMVELLISSDIAKYCEFKSITRVLTQLDGQLQQVPCSRADVFSSRQVSMIEKRMLMKLLTFCVEFEKHPGEYDGYEEKPFSEFLASRKLTTNVQHYVKHAIAMATEDMKTLEGLKSTQKFLRSLGRYGNTAFLWPLYGSGELPQCFCRMCAVFGGIYCLRRTGVSLVVNEEKKCRGIIDTEGERLESKWVVLESSYASGALVPDGLGTKSISRGILVTDRSLHASDSEHITLLNLKACGGQKSDVTIIELSSMSMACPKDTYLVHLTCDGTSGPEDDFAPVLSELFQPTIKDCSQEDDTRPVILWSVFFTQADTTCVSLNEHGVEGVFVVGGPDRQLDFDHAIQEARDIFEKICPGEEFLPRAPNPEDIIYDDDQHGPHNQGSGFEPEGPASQTPSTSDTSDADTKTEDKTEQDDVAQSPSIHNSQAKEEDKNKHSLAASIDSSVIEK